MIVTRSIPPALAEAVATDRLLERALLDACAAVAAYATIGRTEKDAIAALDDLRELFEEKLELRRQRP